jgi:hypothetical protein
VGPGVWGVPQPPEALANVKDVYGFP